ncbi:MAG: helix-turn-helix transcriptional regulator [Bacteroidales bacterium]|nr:helix-turn-helix transcriptional regulator [Bacteroidales bacterium]
MTREVNPYTLVSLPSDDMAFFNVRKIPPHQFFDVIHQILDLQMQQCEVDLEAISRMLHISRFQLNRKVKNLKGISMKEYVQAYRLARACMLLRQSSLSVYEIALACGFRDNSYFSRFFKKEKGMTPRQYAGRC